MTQERLMRKTIIIYIGLILYAVLGFTIGCGDEEEDDEAADDGSFENVDCAAVGNDESLCDFHYCESKSEKRDAVSACEKEEEEGERDEDDPSCTEISGCYDRYATCYADYCPSGSSVAAANEEALLECGDALNACLVGGDPNDPIDVLDCDGQGTDPETCNYNACWTVGVAKEDREDCEKEGDKDCDEIYECYWDWVICYSDNACRPGKPASSLDMEANTECNEEREECKEKYGD